MASMATSCDEVWVSKTVLLCFDGHVLEVFGLLDTHRFNVAMGLEIDVLEGRSPKCKIKAKLGPSMTVYCDRDRLEELRAFAKVVAHAAV